MRVSPINVATSVTRMITSTVGIAIAYFRGRKKSCTGCDVSTNGCVLEARTKRPVKDGGGGEDTEGKADVEPVVVGRLVPAAWEIFVGRPRAAFFLHHNN